MTWPKGSDGLDGYRQGENRENSTTLADFFLFIIFKLSAKVSKIQKILNWFINYNLHSAVEITNKSSNNMEA